MNKTPLIHIAKKSEVSFATKLLVRAAAIVLGILVVLLFINATAGVDPLTGFFYLWEGAFGNSIYLEDTLFTTAKLLCIAVALAPAFKMRFWNCGAEGQVLAGGLATAIVMVYGANLPAPVLNILMFAAAIVTAGLWGFIPAFFKVKMGVNETLFTLMMNYVAIQFVDFFYNTWKGDASSLGKLNKASKSGYLPDLFGKSENWLILSVILLTVGVYFYLKKTKAGYEISVVGESERTANYAGIDVAKVTIKTMILSGAICGICGFMTVSGRDHSIASTTTAGGFGFTAIIVAWLAKFNTGIMALISLFLVFLERGTANVANRCANFDNSASKIVIGIMLFLFIGSEFFLNYRIVFANKKKEGR